jgi:alcohol dehydrogenase class IV
MLLRHKLCHTIGGNFSLPHAGTRTIILPHARSYNAPRILEEMKRLAEVLPGNEGDDIDGLNSLLSKPKVERSLKASGMKESDIDKAADIAVANPYWKPRETS